jgi:deazaflavin-dependent oxidoreductase (nitroreductase family)
VVVAVAAVSQPSWPRSEVTDTGLRAFSIAKNDTMPVRSFNDANAFYRMMRSFAATKVGVALFRPTAHHLDQLVGKLTGGKRSFAEIALGLPAVIVTTTGAKSGEPRTVVVFGIPHPDGLSLIASNFGGAKHPAWYHNLKANPEATVSIEGDTCPTRHTPRARRDLGERRRVLPRLEKVRSASV